MPWQQQVFDTAGEYDPATGIPYYGEVGFTVPRQSGKTSIVLAFDCHRGLWWQADEPQHVTYTAQSGTAARAKWLRDLFPLIERSQLGPFVDRVSRGMGNESLVWKTGGRIDLGSSSESAGHGPTIHMANIDEMFHDKDFRREQALRPSMITVDDRQLLLCSTAGDQGSHAWNTKLRRGRRAVREDKGHGVAWFEWSAPEHGWDPHDEETWWTFMPALGHTISVATIRSELEGMDIDEFRRAYGNLTSRTRDTLIPIDVWGAVVSEGAKPKEPLLWAVEVAPDRTTAAIAVAGANRVAEVVEHQGGTEWVNDRLAALVATHGGRVVRHRQSPAGSLALAGVDDLGTDDVVGCCQRFYDAVVGHTEDDEPAPTIEVRHHPALNAAVAGAVKKQVGDRWMFSRTSSAEDPSPLLAAAIALGGVLGGLAEQPTAGDKIAIA